MKKYCNGGYCKHADENGMVDTKHFTKSSSSPDGLQSMCTDCRKVHNIENHAKNNPLRKIFYKLAGGFNKYYALSEEDRRPIRSEAKRIHLLRLPENDLPATKPARKREGFSPIEPLERHGWVYIMDTYRYLKIGKTWEDGLRARRSEARRWCPADIVHKAWFEDAIYAEKEIHRRLARYKVIKENVGEELFNCAISVARDEIKKLQTEGEYAREKEAVG